MNPNDILRSIEDVLLHKQGKLPLHTVVVDPSTGESRQVGSFRCVFCGAPSHLPVDLQCRTGLDCTAAEHGEAP